MKYGFPLLAAILLVTLILLAAKPKPLAPGPEDERRGVRDSGVAGHGQRIMAWSEAEIEHAIRDKSADSFGRMFLRDHRSTDCQRPALREWKRVVNLPLSSSDTSGQEDPRENVLRWLEPGQHPEIIEDLTALFRSDIASLRKLAVEHLAAFGREDLVISLTPLFSKPQSTDATKGLSEFFIRGVAIALAKNRATDGFRKACFSIVESAVDSSENFFLFGKDEPATVLLKLDPERAAPKLIAQFGDTNAPKCWQSINAFLECPERVDAELLLELIKRCRNLDSTNPTRSATCFSAALKVLAAQKHPKAKALIDEELADESAAPKDADRKTRSAINICRRGASEALCILNDFTYPSRKLELRPYFVERRKMSTVESDFENMLDGEVRNGGFNQYFFNSAGNWWKADLGALERMGATEHANILRRACSVFPQAKPPVSQAAREKPMDNWSKQEKDLLDACDTDWYTAAESLEGKRLLYALKHRAELDALPDPLKTPIPLSK